MFYSETHANFAPKFKVFIMKPINFKESTKILRRPESMSDADCGALPVWSDGKQCVSCWRPNFKERLLILFTGKVWLGVMSGKTQPPVFLAGERVFAKTPIFAHIRAFFASIKESIAEAVETLKNAAKQSDKREHFIAGFAITLIAALVLCKMFRPEAYLFGFGIGCIAGAMKEWWDSYGHGEVEWLDFIFTAMGAVAATLLLTPFYFIFTWHG